MHKSLSEIGQAEVKLESSVEDKFAKIKERSKELNVEQDLFLSYKTENDQIIVTDCFEPSEILGEALLVSINPEDYSQVNKNQINNFTLLFQELSNYKDCSLFYKLLLFGVNLREKHRAQEVMETLPAKYFIGSCDQLRKVTPHVVTKYAPKDFYLPDASWHNNLFAPEREDVIKELKNLGVNGYYHTHPSHLLEPSQKFSQEDINFASKLKYFLKDSKLLIGVGNSNVEDYFITI